MRKILSNKRGALRRQEDCIYTGDNTFIIGKNIIRLSDSALHLLALMNGQNSDRILKQKIAVGFKIRLNNIHFNHFVGALKKNNLMIGRVQGCLLSKLSRTYLDQLRSCFNRKQVREPLYAGICYSKTIKGLRRQLDKSFASVNLSRLRILCKGIKMIKGAIVPHSNIDVSGACAAWAYTALSEIALPELVVILAPYHTDISYRFTGFPLTPYTVLSKDFRTPLGLVETDKNLCSMVARDCHFDIFSDPLVHLAEHSIEMQLPFLQHICRLRGKQMKILPVICSDAPYPSKNFNLLQVQFIKSLRKAVLKSRKKTVFLATGDLMHTGRNSSGPLHHANNDIIRALKKSDAREFRMRTASIRHRFCGREPFYTLLMLLNHPKMRILHYSWAGNSKRSDLPHGLTMDIGYTSMVFY